MTKYAYYPGCSLDSTGKPYRTSVELTAPLLGVELQEIEDWNCCGATAYMSYDHVEAFSVASRNLAIAERDSGNGKVDITAPCSACFAVLNNAVHYMAEDPKLRECVNTALEAAGYHYESRARVRHLLDVYINDVPPEVLQDKIVKDLGMATLAPYYGCQIVRPKNDFDEPEQPHKFDDYLKLLGSQVAYYPVKTKCCAGTFITTQPEIAARMIGLLLKTAKAGGADAIVTCCPLCQFNLDNFQKEAGEYWNEEFDIPILYFTQVVGLALGLSPEELDLKKHRVSADALLAKII
ncbi:MAG: CoB--CoM heterodisulfide reductase iron-sulfur subunit B family protein [Candidatus Zixiibacteriota bacterium]|jgi:heterodisulfide reductase subunit B